MSVLYLWVNQMLSMPLDGLLQNDTIRLLIFCFSTNEVSMPIQISLHFYRQELMFLLIYWQRVNAHSGFSSFPQWVKKDRNSNILCVNAHSGFSSFPRTYCLYDKKKLTKVSMPIRASLHFQVIPYIYQFNMRNSVNAHSGFSSFPQHPSESRRNKAFSRPFLQIFI